MAIELKSIPTLKSAQASEFIKKADAKFKKRATVDFSKQVATSYAILNKANG